MSQYAIKRFSTIVPIPIGVSVIVSSFTYLIARMTRASLLEALSHSERGEFVTAARGLGASARSGDLWHKNTPWCHERRKNP